MHAENVYVVAPIIANSACEMLAEVDSGVLYIQNLLIQRSYTQGNIVRESEDQLSLFFSQQTTKLWVYVSAGHHKTRSR